MGLIMVVDDVKFITVVYRLRLTLVIITSEISKSLEISQLSLYIGIQNSMMMMMMIIIRLFYYHLQDRNVAGVFINH